MQRLLGDAEGTGQDVGGATGQRAEGYRRAQQTRRGFPQRTVTTQGKDHGDSILGCLTSQDRGFSCPGRRLRRDVKTTVRQSLDNAWNQHRALLPTGGRVVDQDGAPHQSRACFGAAMLQNNIPGVPGGNL